MLIQIPEKKQWIDPAVVSAVIVRDGIDPIDPGKTEIFVPGGSFVATVDAEAMANAINQALGSAPHRQHWPAVIGKVLSQAMKNVDPKVIESVALDLVKLL